MSNWGVSWGGSWNFSWGTTQPVAPSIPHWGVSWGVSWGNSWGAATAPQPARSSGGGRIIGEYFRKFTKKDERELKKLLLKAVETEKKQAQEQLERKAKDLQDVANAYEGIRHAVDLVQLIIIEQAKRQEITWIKAQQLINDLEDEEDLILMLALV